MTEFTAFSDELQKIAAASEQETATRPHVPMNKAVVKQHLVNAGLIAAGTGVGFGTGKLVRSQLKKLKGPRSSKWRQAVATGAPVVGAIGGGLLAKMVTEKKKDKLEEAYKKSQEKKQ